MTLQEQCDLEHRILSAVSPWKEMLRWLQESRENGWNLPEEREAFVGRMVLLSSDLSVVVRRAHR